MIPPLLLLGGAVAGLAWWGSRKAKLGAVPALPPSAPKLDTSMGRTTPTAVPQNWGQQSPAVDPLTDLPFAVNAPGSLNITVPVPAKNNADASPYTAAPSFLVPEANYFDVFATPTEDKQRDATRAEKERQREKDGWGSHE